MGIRGKAKACVLRWFGLGLVICGCTQGIAGPCVFEEAVYYPTPSVSWTHERASLGLAGDVSGFVVYWKEPEGSSWQRGNEVPCQRYIANPADPNDEDHYFCPGLTVGPYLLPGEISWPLQRGLNLTANRVYEFCVRAKDLNNQESTECSNVVQICWAPYRVF